MSGRSAIDGATTPLRVQVRRYMRREPQRADIIHKRAPVEALVGSQCPAVPARRQRAQHLERGVAFGVIARLIDYGRYHQAVAVIDERGPEISQPRGCSPAL